MALQSHTDVEYLEFGKTFNFSTTNPNATSSLDVANALSNSTTSAFNNLTNNVTFRGLTVVTLS